MRKFEIEVYQQPRKLTPDGGFPNAKESLDAAIANLRAEHSEIQYAIDYLEHQLEEVQEKQELLDSIKGTIARNPAQDLRDDVSRVRKSEIGFEAPEE